MDFAKLKFRPRHLLVAGILVAVILLATLGGLTAARAKVIGSTPAERIASICRIADQDSLGAETAIAEAAAKEPDPSVRAAALAALARYMGPRHRALIESSLQDPQESVRAAAATGLGRFRDKAAMDRLANLVANEPSEMVRLAAVDGLGLSPSPENVVTLMTAVETNSQDAVKVKAFGALFRAGGVARPPAAHPENPVGWRTQVECVKHLDAVEKSYQAAGVPLQQHPEHLPPQINQNQH
jgi:HEAT repeat protein